MPDRHEEKQDRAQAAKNVRLAVLLGLVAFAIYAGYIFTYYY